MQYILNADALEQLIQINNDDKETIDIIYDVIKGFEEYHARIVEMELKLKLYPSGMLECEVYQNMVTELDKRRTMGHDSVLTGVNILNRIAEKQGLELIYKGTVSKNRPYRREVADAVLNYLQKIIENRR